MLCALGSRTTVHFWGRSAASSSTRFWVGTGAAWRSREPLGVAAEPWPSCRGQAPTWNWTRISIPCFWAEFSWRGLTVATASPCSTPCPASRRSRDVTPRVSHTACASGVFARLVFLGVNTGATRHVPGGAAQVPAMPPTWSAPETGGR